MFLEFDYISFDYSEGEQEVCCESSGTAIQVRLKHNNPIIILDQLLTKEKVLEYVDFCGYTRLRKGVGYKGEVHRLVYFKKNGNKHLFYTMIKKGQRLTANREGVLEVSESGLRYIYPLVLSPDLTGEGFSWSENYIIFPYKPHSRQPVSQEVLREEAPELYKYFKSHERILMGQSRYNRRIQNTREFYGVIRVGYYTYANWYVCIRDNTKPNPCLIGKITTHWGEEKIPIFDNHVSYISFKDKESASKVYNKLKEVEPLIMALFDERSIGARLPFKILP